MSNTILNFQLEQLKNDNEFENSENAVACEDEQIGFISFYRNVSHQSMILKISGVNYTYSPPKFVDLSRFRMTSCVYSKKVRI